MPKNFPLILSAGLIVFSCLAIAWGIKLRFSNLNQPFWSDEFMVIRVGKGLDPATGVVSLGQSIKMYQEEHMLYPVLVNVVIHYWLRLGESITWSRLLPTLFGVLGLVYLYKLGKASGLKSAAVLLSVAVATTSWAFVHYSEEVAAHGLGITATFALIYYLRNYLEKPNTSGLVKLLAAALIGTLVSLGSWVLLLPVGITLFISARRRNAYRDFFVFTSVALLLIGYTAFDFYKYRAPWALTATYLHRLQLNSVPPSQMPVKLVKDNIDYLAYVFGASPWYLDAYFFPSVTRFGFWFTAYYYLSLVAVIVLISVGYIYKALVISSNTNALFKRLLPLLFLLTVMAAVNILSFFGKYPIGPYRQSLFYAPLVIWTLMEFLDLLLRKVSLLSLAAVGLVAILVMNSLMRLSRVPQRHIGLVFPAEASIGIGSHLQQQHAMPPTADIG